MVPSASASAQTRRFGRWPGGSTHVGGTLSPWVAQYCKYARANRP